MNDKPFNNNRDEVPLSFPKLIGTDSAAEADQDLHFPALELEPRDVQGRQAPNSDPADVPSTQPKHESSQEALCIIRQLHPRIADAIEATWGHPECLRYLQKLLADDEDPRDRVRAGFPVSVTEALLSLLSLHPTLPAAKESPHPAWPRR